MNLENYFEYYNGGKKISQIALRTNMELRIHSESGVYGVICNNVEIKISAIWHSLFYGKFGRDSNISISLPSLTIV